MKKIHLWLLVFAFMNSSVMAQPVPLSNSQLDKVTAGMSSYAQWAAWFSQVRITDRPNG